MKPLLVLKAALKTIVLPPISLLLIALVAIIVAGRGKAAARHVALACIAALLLLATPGVALLLVDALGVPAPFTTADATNCGAVVILSGGVRTDAPDYGGHTLSTLTLERVRYGARIARATGLPVLVTGGTPQGGTPEAVLMREALEQEFKVPVRWVEPGSDNTRENARLSAALLHQANVSRVVLVTHVFDMRRARAEFESAGIAVVPAATNLPGAGPYTVLDWVPSISGLQLSYYATYEIAGNVVRVLMNWIGSGAARAPQPS